MRGLVFGLLGLAVAAGGAAYAGTRDVLTANTLILTDPSDQQTSYLLEPGGGFAYSTYDHQHGRGHWTYANGRLCLTPDGQAQACVPMGDDRVVGYAWDIKGPTGEVAWHAEIVPGRQRIGLPGESPIPSP